jgi:hypothetical protein
MLRGEIEAVEGGKMKALSSKQPLAGLVIAGIKSGVTNRFSGTCCKIRNLLDKSSFMTIIEAYPPVVASVNLVRDRLMAVSVFNKGL